MVFELHTKHTKGRKEMNEILLKFEELSTEDLTYIFEYLVDYINERKRKEKKNGCGSFSDTKRV